MAPAWLRLANCRSSYRPRRCSSFAGALWWRGAGAGAGRVSRCAGAGRDSRGAGAGRDSRCAGAGRAASRGWLGGRISCERLSAGRFSFTRLSGGRFWFIRLSGRFWFTRLSAGRFSFIRFWFGRLSFTRLGLDRLSLRFIELRPPSFEVAVEGRVNGRYPSLDLPPAFPAFPWIGPPRASRGDMAGG